MQRRIGANELDAIEICGGFVDAENQYATQARDQHGVREYAQQIMTSPGQHDGLYWTGAQQPLVPRGFAEADVAARTPIPSRTTDTSSASSDRKAGMHPKVNTNTSSIT